MPHIIPIKDSRNTSELFESTMRQLSMHQDIEMSEKQIENGQIREAKTALAEMREKYGL